MFGLKINMDFERKAQRNDIKKPCSPTV